MRRASILWRSLKQFYVRRVKPNSSKLPLVLARDPGHRFRGGVKAPNRHAVKWIHFVESGLHVCVEVRTMLPEAGIPHLFGRDEVVDNKALRSMDSHPPHQTARADLQDPFQPWPDEEELVMERQDLRRAKLRRDPGQEFISGGSAGKPRCFNHALPAKHRFLRIQQSLQRAIGVYEREPGLVLGIGADKQIEAGTENSDFARFERKVELNRFVVVSLPVKSRDIVISRPRLDVMFVLLASTGHDDDAFRGRQCIVACPIYQQHREQRFRWIGISQIRIMHVGNLVHRKRSYGTAAYSGRLMKARDFSRRAMESAERAEEKETAATYSALSGL